VVVHISLYKKERSIKNKNNAPLPFLNMPEVLERRNGSSIAVRTAEESNSKATNQSLGINAYLPYPPNPNANGYEE
jgi:hypothetical protein